MGVYFPYWHLQFPRGFLYPLAFCPERIEIGHHTSGVQSLHDLGYQYRRIANLQQQRRPPPPQRRFRLLQAAEHEVVMPPDRLGVVRHETEENEARPFPHSGDLARKEQRPVVLRPLIAAHPINDGPAASPAGRDFRHASRINARVDFFRQIAHQNPPDPRETTGNNLESTIRQSVRTYHSIARFHA